MDVIHLAGSQKLGGLLSLQCLPQNLRHYQMKRTNLGTGTVGFQIKTSPFLEIQLRLSSHVDSTNSLRDSTEPVSVSLGVTLTQATGISPRNGFFLDIRGDSVRRLGGLQLGFNLKRSRNFRLATADEGSAASETGSTFGDDGTTPSSTNSSQRRSITYAWISRLKEADWNKVIFNCEKDEKIWTVPWNGQTIFQVMILWFAAFWVMGSWVIPIAAQIAGFSRHSLTFRGQALYSLITDIAEGIVGMWILKRCLSQFLPLPEGWFPVKLKGNWLFEASWGCILFPIVNRLSKLNLYLIPLPPLTTSYVEQSMMSRDPVATLLYAIVISVCAPIWEEVIFRGFLLPSMTSYLPLWGAIFVSALAFALAHFSLQRVLPLTFLGLVMGVVFVRSKNLVASIVLHSLWNGFAFMELL